MGRAQPESVPLKCEADDGDTNPGFRAGNVKMRCAPTAVKNGVLDSSLRGSGSSGVGCDWGIYIQVSEAGILSK